MIAGRDPSPIVVELYKGPSAGERPAEITEAECYLASQIGVPVDQPRLTHLRVRCYEAELSRETETRISAVVDREVAAIPQLWRSFLANGIPVA